MTAGSGSNRDTCTLCGRDIVWTMTVGGRRVRIDPDPHPGGTIVPTTTADGERRARVLTGPELPAQGRAWRAHEITCPESAEFRRRQGIASPKCRACSQPMRPLIHPQQRFHPCCEPPADFREQVQQARKETTR